MRTTTHVPESIAPAPTPAIPLLLAFELGERTWKLGFTIGLGQRPRIRRYLPARRIEYSRRFRARRAGSSWPTRRRSSAAMKPAVMGFGCIGVCWRTA